MRKTKFSYLFHDIPDDIFSENAEKECFDENFFDNFLEDIEEEFSEECCESQEYLCGCCGYLTDAEYLRKYYGLVTH